MEEDRFQISLQGWVIDIYVVDMSTLFFFLVLFWTIAKNRGERGERR